MIHAIVAPIKTAIEALDIADKVGGIVMPLTKEIEGQNNIIFPVSCDISGQKCYEDGRYFDLLPSESYKTVMYFEQRSGVRYIGPKGPGSGTMVYEANVRLVGWLNAKKLGFTDCSITSRVVLTVIKAILAEQAEYSRNAGRFTVTDGNYTNAIVEAEVVQQVPKDPSIFSAYTVQQELLYPFDYFAIDLKCFFEVGKNCFVEVVTGTEIEC